MLNSRILRSLLPMIFATSLLVISQVSMAKEVKFIESTSQPPKLLELYSSQGCSSCPPAQVWVQRFKNDPDLWNEVIPMVFHVDYWDYIGWKDPFANKRFSQRQRRFKKIGNINSVYTPGFVVDGKEWTGWFTQTPLTNHRHSLEPTGVLSARLTQDSVAISFKQPHKSDNKALHLPPEIKYTNIAVLGFGLETKATRGENAHKVLMDDFVVLGYKKSRYQQTEHVTKYPKLSNKADNYAVVVWLTKNDELTPVQSVGGYLPSAWKF